MKLSIKATSVLALSALVFSLSAAPAQAATKTIQISRYVTLQVPTSITVPKGGCADLKVKFRIRDRGINYPYHSVSLSVSKGTGWSVIYPGSDWTGELDGYRGTKIVKLCKYDWFDEEEEEETNAVKNGRYTFRAMLLQTKPFAMWKSPKVTITVRG